MPEEWRDIPGHEGRYQVSDLGNVRSVNHYVRCGRNGSGQRLVRGRVLRPGCIDKFRHLSVALGKGNSQGVHTLVALAFIGPRPPGLDIAHWNSIGDDNRWCNLVYTERSENNSHRVPNGRGKITLEQARQLRAAADYNASVTLALAFGISSSYANNIRRGHSLVWL